MQIYREDGSEQTYLRIAPDPSDRFTSYRLSWSAFEVGASEPYRRPPTVRCSLLSCDPRTPDDLERYIGELQQVLGAWRACQEEANATYRARYALEAALAAGEGEQG
jgi:hypothetical protein